jgi:hypothetical protein
MSFSRPIQWYHSHTDPIWPDGTLKTGFINIPPPIPDSKHKHRVYLFRREKKGEKRARDVVYSLTGKWGGGANLDDSKMCVLHY